MTSVKITISGLSENIERIEVIKEAFGSNGRLMQGLLTEATSTTDRWYNDKADWFDNPSSPTHGAGRKDTQWVKKLSKNWSGEFSPEGFNVVFSSQDKFVAGSFLTQITGRTITTKKSALTIPIKPEAHGLSVKGFQQAEGVELFRPKGKSYLAYSLGRGEGISVVYLLRKSVTVPSLKKRTGREPLPIAEDFATPLRNKGLSIINRILK